MAHQQIYLDLGKEFFLLLLLFFLIFLLVVVLLLSVEYKLSGPLVHERITLNQLEAS